MDKYHILICDDEKEIIDVLALYFDSDLYEIHKAYNGAEAYEILIRDPIDLALIDIMMPQMNGLDLIRLVRDKLAIPLLVMSALDSLNDKLKGYDMGADDYITKPFEPMEVLAKVKSRLRQKKEPDACLESADIVLDLKRCQVRVNQEVYDLTKVEWAVLKLLMKEPQRVFTKAQIYRAGWEVEYLYNDNSIRVIINRLRQMVGASHIETIRGLGYRWQA